MNAEDSRPLTVLILNPMGEDGWGGVERWFLDVGLGLRGRGHRVLSVGRPGALWTRRCLEEKFETRATPMRGDLSIGEARAVAFWMQEQRVDVLLTKLHKGIRLGGLSARFAGHVPLVAFMGLVEAKPGWRYRWTYRLFLHWVLTLSPSMRRDILAVGAGIPEDRVVAIPYGVVPGDYEVPAAAAAAARASLGAGPGDLLVVAVGRLHEQKRFDLLLDAFAAVQKKVPAARLAVVGTGDLRVDLLTRAREAGVADHVLFAGFRADVPAILAAADLFALSSDDEGLPMVVIEAMAAGRAVVATDVGSVRDLVEDGVTGRVVPRRDPAALAEAMAALLLDESKRQAMGEAGRARVRERYPLDRCIRDTEAFLLRVAGRS
jgi:glycosyltransferase involved in cell wall biosynthesis